MFLKKPKLHPEAEKAEQDFLDSNGLLPEELTGWKVFINFVSHQTGKRNSMAVNRCVMLYLPEVMPYDCTSNALLKLHRRKTKQQSNIS